MNNFFRKLLFLFNNLHCIFGQDLHLEVGNNKVQIIDLFSKEITHHKYLSFDKLELNNLKKTKLFLITNKEIIKNIKVNHQDKK